MIAGRDFFDADLGTSDGIGAYDGINDGLWCQSAHNNSNIGVWYFPDGNEVPSEDSDETAVYMYTSAAGQVGLLHDDYFGASAINTSTEGLYSCTILDESRVSQTLYIWAATNEVYDQVNGMFKVMKIPMHYIQ